MVDIATTAFPEPPDIRDALLTLAGRELRTGGMLSGYLPHGLPELRSVVAARFEVFGIPTAPSQILITNGAQQAATLLSALFLPDGGPVYVENPTWSGLLDVLRGNNAHLLPIAVDAEGAAVETIVDNIERSHPQLVWLTPDFHNPTGVSLSVPRRRLVAQLAIEKGLSIVEDQTLRGLPVQGEAQPLIASYSPESIISVGSCSKLFWPGLRIGWIRASETLITRLARLKSISDNGCGVVDQYVAAELLASVDTQIDKRRPQVQRALNRWSEALNHYVPAWKWDEPSGGLSMWVQLPHGSAFEFLQVALRFGVAFVPGPVFSANGAFRDFLRIPLSVDATVINLAAERLGRAWEAYRQMGAPTIGTREGVAG